MCVYESAAFCVVGQTSVYMYILCSPRQCIVYSLCAKGVAIAIDILCMHGEGLLQIGDIHCRVEKHILGLFAA